MNGMIMLMLIYTLKSVVDVETSVVGPLWIRSGQFR